MNAENQELLNAIRGVVTEAIAPLEARFDGLEARFDGLEARLATVEGSIRRLEDLYETLDTRTSQMMSDLIYLRDRVPMLEERIDNGFRALKSDLNLAFSDIRRISGAQERGEKSLDVLKKELASLQQRIATLESTQ